MGMIEKIMDDYERLIKTQYMIPLSNGDMIDFTFTQQDLPHLLGLQHLIDIPVLFEYSNGRLSATKLIKGIRDGTIDTASFEHSIYFDELYKSRIKFFSSDMILDIIKSKQIVKFHPERVQGFQTKLNKIEYIFWNVIRDEQNHHGYFGIGFMSKGEESDRNYPNTFFFRSDSLYIDRQEQVLPLSRMTRDKDKNCKLDINWDLIRRSMKKNAHYKYLAAQNGLIGTDGEILEDKVLKGGCDCSVEHHYRLLLADEMQKAYFPYMEGSFRWNNVEKEFVIQKSRREKRTFLPSEIKMILNELRQNKDGSFPKV